MSETAKERTVGYLKSIVVPEIKNLGFSGTFPHFRRENNDRFEFLTFQFNRHGGSFVVECGFATKKDLPEFSRKLLFNKLNYGHVHPNNRARIKPDYVSEEDFWFSYGSFSTDIQFETLAKDVKSLIPKVEQFLKK